jgi:hypothetical protein
MDALSSIWNEDGTPKRPEPDQGAEHAFADLGMQVGNNQALYLSYAKAREEAMKNTPATVGDIVHYWYGPTGSCQAAIVCSGPDLDDGINLFVLPNHSFASPTVMDGVEHNEGKTDNTWHWAESA